LHLGLIAADPAFDLEVFVIVRITAFGHQRCNGVVQ